MQRFTSRAPALLEAKRTAHRETIERSEINDSVFPGHDTKRPEIRSDPAMARFFPLIAAMLR